MAGKITALEPQKHASDRLNVFLDGMFAFGVAEIVAATLKVGAWLSDEAILELKAADGVELAHSRALDYLSYRPRSEAELRRHLAEKAVPDDVVEVVVARLVDVGLIDDGAFARYWRDSRARFRPRGRQVLRYEMGQKGIASEAIDEALDDYDEAAAVRLAAEEQVRRLGSLPPEEARRRLVGRLARRGFSYELIQETLASQDFLQLTDDNTVED
ncbi:MAG: RecX family transcriptional regulator [Anaerolineae bacterium]|nr:RecX family transcriptional regulator [Anaerolineae bacterium]